MPDSGFPPFVPEDKTKASSFAALWPHRWDFIWAAPTAPGEKAAWHTEHRYELSDREIEYPRKLLGVRFGSLTSYLMLDIDINSAYHPRNNPHEFRRILNALEDLGLVRPIIISSSFSGGLHVYFNWFEPLPSWQVAGAAKATLNRAGFVIQAGLLEIFPNPRPWIDGGEQGVYNAHRLPMQAGSYLLDEANFMPIFSDRDAFISRWEAAVLLNCPNKFRLKLLAEASKKRRRRSFTFKAQKFLKDLNDDVELGWTGQGQTNALLGRLALRAYVFGDLLGYEGEDLSDIVYRQALSLPGFVDYCGHKIDLKERCDHWAISVQKSPRYYPYGSNKPTAAAAAEPDAEDVQVQWNRWQEERARDRIRFAIATHLNRGTWPANTADRIAALQSEGHNQGEGFSVQTLYRHADLWHPEQIGRYRGPVEKKKVYPKGAGLGGPRPLGTSENLLPEKAVNPDGSKAQALAFYKGWDDVGRNPLLEADHSDRIGKNGGLNGD